MAYAGRGMVNRPRHQRGADQLERALRVADSLPTEDAGRLAMRVASRTMLCGNAWRARLRTPPAGLRSCANCAPKPKGNRSLAIAMTGLVAEHWQYGRMRLAYEQASEQMALVESIGDPLSTAASAFASDQHQGATR